MNTTVKVPLTVEEQADVIDIALWAGQLMMQHGAESQLIEETVHRLGTALGCHWMDIFVSANAIIVSTISGDDFRTKIRRVPEKPVNMTIVSAVNRLRRRVERGELDRRLARAELRRISDIRSHYNRWLIVFMIGLSCASFSHLFGGDWPVFGVTFVASSVAMFTRQELAHRHFNVIITVTCTAFVATLIASTASLFGWGEKPELALAACVLLLVPGVPLINAMEDLMKGHINVGMVRWVVGSMITLSIAIGMILAISLTGVSQL